MVIRNIKIIENTKFIEKFGQYLDKDFLTTLLNHFIKNFGCINNTYSKILISYNAKIKNITNVFHNITCNICHENRSKYIDLYSKEISVGYISMSDINKFPKVNFNKYDLLINFLKNNKIQIINDIGDIQDNTTYFIWNDSYSVKYNKIIILLLRLIRFIRRNLWKNTQLNIVKYNEEKTLLNSEIVFSPKNGVYFEEDISYEEFFQRNKTRDKYYLRSIYEYHISKKQNEKLTKYNLYNKIYKIAHPKHANYSSIILLDDNHYFTIKADGIQKYLYIEELNTYAYCEIIDDKMIVYDVDISSLSYVERILYIYSHHPSWDYNDIMDINNIGELLDLIKYINSWINLFIENDKTVNWFPKLVWKFDINYFKKNIKEIMNIFSDIDTIYKNDGLIATHNYNNKLCMKFKPYNKLTIDVNIINGEAFSKEKEILFDCFNLTNGINELLYVKEKGIWEFYKKRDDKILGDTIYTINMIKNQIKSDFYSYNYLNTDDKYIYYKLSDIKHDIDNEKRLKKVLNIILSKIPNYNKMKVINFGCGFTTFNEFSKIVNCDIDNYVLWNTNASYYNFNLSYEQNKLNDFYKFNKFDIYDNPNILIFKHCYHYFYTCENIINLIKDFYKGQELYMILITPTPTLYDIYVKHNFYVKKIYNSNGKIIEFEYKYPWKKDVLNEIYINISYLNEELYKHKLKIVSIISAEPNFTMSESDKISVIDKFWNSSYHTRLFKIIRI